MNYLIIDDHHVIRSSYKLLIREVCNSAAIFEAACCKSGAKLWLEIKPDVVILDINLPDRSGLELAREMLALLPATKIIIFSMHDETQIIKQSVHIGVMGYVSKTATPEVLIEALRTVETGQPYFEPRLSSQVIQSDRVARAQASHLSTRETDVLIMTAKGLSIAQMSQHLNLSPKTISNNLCLIKQKLNLSTHSALTHYALKRGLINISQIDQPQ